MQIIEQNTVDCTLNDGLLMASPCLFKSNPHVSWWNPNFCVCDIKLKHNFVRHINLHPLFIGAFSGTCKISKTCWNLISSTKCWLVQSTIERLYISSIWPKMSCNVLVQQCRNVYPYKLMVGIPSLYGQVGDGGSYITILILGVIWQCVKTLYPWWTSK